MIAKVNGAGRLSEAFEVQHSFEVDGAFVSIHIRLNISQWTENTFQVWGVKQIYTVRHPAISKCAYSEEFPTVEFDTVEEATAFYSKRILNAVSTIRAETFNVDEQGEIVCKK